MKNMIMKWLQQWVRVVRQGQQWVGVSGETGSAVGWGVVRQGQQWVAVWQGQQWVGSLVKQGHWCGRVSGGLG